MGEVYKARDTRLERIVAVKTSRQAFTDRFEREARAIAALNHPNICQLYDVGPDYLVMEFIDGHPVAPVDSPRKLLDIAVQIADGLAAAHAAGVGHRDLKPDNILIARDGRVRILDFGLAKQAATAESQSRPADATRTVALADAGTTVGTIAYMSPEQARGEPELTPQSDQFSFGLVLYEMLTGKRAFQARQHSGNHDRDHSRGVRTPATHCAGAAALDRGTPAGQEPRRALRFHARFIPRASPTARLPRARLVLNRGSGGRSHDAGSRETEV